MFSIIRPLHAQELTLDAGYGGVRYADSLSNSVASVSAALFAGNDLASIALAAGGGWLNDGTASAQGSFAASLATPRWHYVRTELAAEGGGSAVSSTTTGEALGFARLRVEGRHMGAWAGAGAGGVTSQQVTRQELADDAGLWLRAGTALAELSARGHRLADSLTWLDTQASLAYRIGRFDLDASGGVRSGDRAAIGNTSGWANASVYAWITDHVALLASGGSYALDPAQGFPGGQYLSLALHLSLRGRLAAPPLGIYLPAEPPFQARDTTGGVALRVRLPGVTRAELMGDFTDWQPQPLQPLGHGWFELVVPISPGLHQVAVRTTGDWEAPPGLGTTSDDFGGTVGVLVIP